MRPGFYGCREAELENFRAFDVKMKETRVLYRLLAPRLLTESAFTSAKACSMVERAESDGLRHVLIHSTIEGH